MRSIVVLDGLGRMCGIGAPIRLLTRLGRFITPCIQLVLHGHAVSFRRLFGRGARGGACGTVEGTGSVTRVPGTYQLRSPCLGSLNCRLLHRCWSMVAVYLACVSDTLPHLYQGVGCLVPHVVRWSGGVRPLALRLRSCDRAGAIFRCSGMEAGGGFVLFHVHDAVRQLRGLFPSVALDRARPPLCIPPPRHAIVASCARRLARRFGIRPREHPAVSLELHLHRAVGDCVGQGLRGEMVPWPGRSAVGQRGLRGDGQRLACLRARPRGARDPGRRGGCRRRRGLSRSVRAIFRSAARRCLPFFLCSGVQQRATEPLTCFPRSPCWARRAANYRFCPLQLQADRLQLRRVFRRAEAGYSPIGITQMDDRIRLEERSETPQSRGS
mmetsp:Transcript_103882/g.318192  ORF Transcript_103882/g.318192 Transcript_103882/m.318192 type:complete len:383 (-) Transcript_103882:42-1190(-)